ncbi:MAG TPA: amidase [Candidatus Dormibacteraeota bacterium]|nr:amidase [Candidatus Dormibacteraeota bacterium]
MQLEDAKRRIEQHRGLHAFISISDETGDGPIVAVKDLIDVKGTVTTAGGIILPKTPAVEDAPVVQRLRRRGCVMVGKTNLHEFAYGVTSINPHYGDVLNPHDPSRVAGGSSGGSAVAVATGMCDWAIGSDTGGSIRIPSALCGIVGFKPALGSIDTTGVVPLSRSLDTLGPMAPDVATAALAFALMTGEAEASMPSARPRFGVPANWVRDLDEQTSRAWALVSKGVPEIQFVDHGRLFRDGLTILMVEASVFHRRWVAEHADKYGADVLTLLRRGLEILAVDYEEARAARPGLQAAAYEAMSDIDALILPTTAIVAPPVTAGIEAREPLARYTRPFNLTGQPVVSLPAPVKGLPVGIQVVGRTNAGALTAAMWLEREWRSLAA